MKIDKVKGTYSEYKLTLSFGQLKELHSALADDHVGPIKDEMFKALDYYLAKLPLPGEDEEKAKEADKASKEEEKSEGEQVDVDHVNSMEDLDKIAPNPPEE